MCKSSVGPDPKAAILVCQQRKNSQTWQTHSRWKHQGYKSDSVKTVQTGISSNPQVTITVLRYGVCRGSEIAIVDLPRAMTVLVEVSVRRQRIGVRRRPAEQGEQEQRKQPAAGHNRATDYSAAYGSFDRR